MMLASSDVFTQLQPRHVCRRERKPGARERHSALRQRHATDFGPSAGNIQKSSVESTNQRGKSYYSMDSAISEFSRNKGNKRNENTEQERVTSSYKDISTIDAIRASMKATASHKSAPPPHIPNWMLDLDINLNVSSVDLIPPFDKELKASERDTETFNEAASLMFVDTDSDGSENDNAYNREIAEDLDTERRKHVNYKIEGDRVQSSRPHSRQNESVPSSRNGVRPMSNTFRIARGFSPTGKENESPRRYQGDKKVMSMQQGGIRSTPFQPKAKKFINQMITYRHMKHHDMKIKKAKPAIDTKMPATFKMALERKQLVEQRFSDSWSRASTSPTPTTSRSSLETKSSKRQSTQRSR